MNDENISRAIIVKNVSFQEETLTDRQTERQTAQMMHLLNSQHTRQSKQDNTLAQ